MQSRIGLRGEIWISEKGILLQRINNLVVTPGLELAAAVFHNSNVRASHVAAGTSAALPALSQTALQGTEAQRVAATISRVGATVYYDVTFGPALVGGPFTIQELGLFNDPTAGTMIGRALTAPWTLDSGRSINVTWGLTFG